MQCTPLETARGFELLYVAQEHGFAPDTSLGPCSCTRPYMKRPVVFRGAMPTSTTAASSYPLNLPNCPPLRPSEDSIAQPITQGQIYPEERQSATHYTLRTGCEFSRSSIITALKPSISSSKFQTIHSCMILGLSSPLKQEYLLFFFPGDGFGLPRKI